MHSKTEVLSKLILQCSHIKKASKKWVHCYTVKTLLVVVHFICTPSTDMNQMIHPVKDNRISAHKGCKPV